MLATAAATATAAVGLLRQKSCSSEYIGTYLHILQELERSIVRSWIDRPTKLFYKNDDAQFAEKINNCGKMIIPRGVKTSKQIASQFFIHVFGSDRATQKEGLYSVFL